MKRILLCLIGVTLIMFSHQAHKDDIFTYNNEETLEIKVNKGQEFTISIRGNPTTGYGWFLKDYTELNSSELLASNLNEYGSTDDYKQDRAPRGFVGQGGAYYFKFKVNENANVAEQKLTFVNKRAWEKTEFKKFDAIVKIL
jgi:predicted secreted protein